MSTTKEEACLKKEHARLNKQYEKFIFKLRWDFFSKRENKIPTSDKVVEIMTQQEREDLRRLQSVAINRWNEYVTPIAEKWWRDRGWGVIWPDDDSKPMQAYKLDPEKETAP
ncbi:hypothetical protein KC842_02410 [Candidatus Nomurabacteria bacterium]|nr:hypothetical protein [Candidatus Nomurabacteria bacterium]